MADGIELEQIENPGSLLQEVLNCLFDGVYIVDRDRRILFWNRGAEEITGYTAAEVHGHWCGDDILEHIDENGKPLCSTSCPLSKAMLTGQRARAKVYPKRKDGKRVPVFTHIAPILNGKGEVIAGIEVFRDITAEENYRVLQEKFNEVVKKYVSHVTYDEMLQQARAEAASGVRTKDLTIFYLDIVGFTSMSERRPPAELVETLNSVFAICDVITRESMGDIDKFIGDALMAVFIDANDAVSAAIRILKDALPELNRARTERGMEEIRVRIGLNSGIVVQGDVGTTDRKDLTVIGDVVNLAQRIQSISDPDNLLISDATRSRLRPGLSDTFVFKGAVNVKGRDEQVRVFSLKA